MIGAIIIRRISFNKKTISQTLSQVHINHISFVNSASSYIQCIREGYKLLPDTCDKFFICTSDLFPIDNKSLDRMLGKRADIIFASRNLNESACFPLLLNKKAMNWCLIYNGNDDLPEALLRLESIHVATIQYARLHKKSTTIFTASPHYQPIINWV